MHGNIFIIRILEYLSDYQNGVVCVGGCVADEDRAEFRCLRTSTYAAEPIHSKQIAFQQTSIQRRLAAGQWCDTLNQLWKSILRGDNYSAALGESTVKVSPEEL